VAFGGPIDTQDADVMSHLLVTSIHFILQPNGQGITPLPKIFANITVILRNRTTSWRSTLN
jgi:hypothetical protein